MQLCAQLRDGTTPLGWTDVNGILMYQAHVFLPDDSTLWPIVLEHAHTMGHEGSEKTLHWLRAAFYNPRARRRVRDCSVCQRNKVNHLQPAGLLQSLPVPSQVWSDIAMDFIEGFLKVGGKSVILTVVDRFSKYSHFIPLCYP
jgi:hypothetical protein